MSKARKQYYKGLMASLGYSQEYIKRIDHCKSENECLRILEFARIHSIYEDMKNG